MVSPPDRQTLADAKAHDTTPTQSGGAPGAPRAGDAASAAPAPESAPGEGSQPTSQQGPPSQQAAPPTPPGRTDAMPPQAPLPVSPPIAQPEPSVARSASAPTQSDPSVARSAASAPTTDENAASPRGTANRRPSSRSTFSTAQRHDSAGSRNSRRLASQATMKADRDAAAQATLDLANQAPRATIESPAADSSAPGPARGGADADALAARRAATLGLQPQPNAQRPRSAEATTPARDRNMEPTRARLEQSWEERERWLSEQLRRK